MGNYHISVPVMNHSCDTDEHRAQFLAQFKRAGVYRVFLCMDRYFTDSPAKRAALELLKTNIAYFKENGIAEVGTWFTAMGHGGTLDHESGNEDRTDYPRVVGFSGGVCDDSFCIADEGYRALIAKYVAEMGACGADIIQLDDDLRLGYRPNGIGCTCEYHMNEFARRTGRTWTREELYEAVYSGAPSETRRAWFALMNEGFEGFAMALRTALDTVSPTTRLGFCAAPTSYDPDCVDAVALARTFAGNTKPYLRGIGAAYWGVNSWHAIEDVIGYERMERAWMKRDPDIEFFTEGDVYPRPRYRVPAWLLETFDTALRADGGMDGILKYMFDYVQTPLYETGYVERHVKHEPLYREIEEAFTGQTRGIYIYEAEHKLLSVTLPTPAPQTGVVTDSSLSAAVRFCNRMSVPYTFAPDGGAVCVMGMSAHLIPVELLSGGAVLDMEAARLLTARGVDCGILSAEPAPAALSEDFPALNGREAENVRTLSGGSYYRVTLKAGAKVLSTFRAGAETYPAAWYYENEAGGRFFVYAFDINSVDRNSQLLCSYARQAQFYAALEAVQGRPSMAVSMGHPHLYMTVKDRADGERVVGLWNCFADEMLTPTVTLDRAYETVSFLGGADGYLDGNRVVFTTDIPAHTFAGFIVK
ncbi:MAG: hypothetical protein IJ449_10590 [Clostridia bacterium]|nr:hypothetical protein [Clostridia bacterium]